ncbi:MAG: PAS-domain containing protein [Pseudomonadota bacterium]
MSVLGWVIIAVLVSAGAVAGWLMIARLRRVEAALDAHEALVDGVLIRAEEYRIIDLSHDAEALPGAERGGRVDALLEALLDDGREEALAALGDLVRSGRPMRLLVTDNDGRPWELSGRPRGGELLFALRDATLAVTELRKSEARIAVRERALEAGWYERRTILNLLNTGSAIAWHRGREGEMIWSSGCVNTRDGSVTAQQTVALVRARPGDAGADENGVIRSRVEILPAGAIEPLPLQVIEVFAADGSATGIATDATVAAQAERTLSRFVQTMTETFAHLTAGLAIFDRNQKLVLFNPAFAQMLQLDPAWLANRPSLRDAIDALRTKRRIPEFIDFHAWRERLLSLFDNPERVDFDEVWHLADGANIKVIARPHPHGSLAFVFDDISDRVRLEQRYRQSIDLQEATLDRLHEALVVFGTNGKLQIVNEAFHEIFGTDPSTVQPGGHAREVMAICAGLTVEAKPWEDVAAFITAADAREPFTAALTLGSNRRLRLRVAPLPGGGTMLVAADVTDSERIAEALRERNDALEAAEEMRTAVLDQISHRLRTPLNTIFGFGQLLSDPRFGQLSDRQREYASGILEASGQLLDTIDEVTDLAALRPGARPESDLAPPLAETLELTRALLQKRAAEAGVGLVARLPEGTLRPACGPEKLRQIVFSMAAGAIQRTAPGGSVSLSAEIQEEMDGLERIAVVATEHERSGATQGAAGASADGTGDAALALTRRMIEGEGGSFSYGADERGEGDRRCLAIFPVHVEDLLAEDGALGREGVAAEGRALDAAAMPMPSGAPSAGFAALIAEPKPAPGAATAPAADTATGLTDAPSKPAAADTAGHGAEEDAGTPEDCNAEDAPDDRDAARHAERRRAGSIGS